MQIKDVQVTAGTDGFSSVRFLGQGGESIDVRLADAAEGGDPVARARAIMTQVASFDVADDPEHPFDADEGASAPIGDAGGSMAGSAEPASGPGGDVWSRPGTRAPLPDRDG